MGIKKLKGKRKRWIIKKNQAYFELNFFKIKKNIKQFKIRIIAF
jgi:hypothetical protein